MSAGQVLAKARALGIVLSRNGEKLRYTAPPDRLTPELLELLKANKPAILSTLDAERDIEFPDAIKSCTTPNEHALQRLALRRRLVEQRLAGNGGLRVAWDADGPLTREPGEPVSVVLAVRTGVGIVSGELQCRAIDSTRRCSSAHSRRWGSHRE